MVSVIEEKSWDLSFLMQMVTEAQEMSDDIQVKKIAMRGIKEAEKQGNTQWKSKFQEIFNQYSQTTSFESLEEEGSELESVDISQGSPDLSQVKGIGASVDAKLRSNGFTTIEMLASSTPEQLARVPGIGVASAQKIIENARAFLGDSSSFPTASAEIPQNAIDEPVEMTPYQKLLARAKENVNEENSKISEQKPEPKIMNWTEKPEASQVLTPFSEDHEPVVEDSPTPNPSETTMAPSLASQSQIAIEVEHFDESTEQGKFAEEFQEETEYKPLYTASNRSVLSSKTDFMEDDDLEPEIIENQGENQAVSFEPKLPPVIRKSATIQPKSIEPSINLATPSTPIPNPPKVSKTVKVPYREARMNSLPNGKQLVQRQQSAQKILRVIKDAGMIEIPMNKPELQNVFQAVDLLACKPMRGENGRCIILLVPIKHVSTVEPVYVWDSHVMTGNFDDEPTTSANMAINTHVKKLVNASEYLFSEIINGKSIISLVSRFVGISVRSDVTFRNKRLYIGGKEIEFQVILDPILLSDTEVLCLEKTLPYAYQQGSNLHIVPFSQLDELLEFLQLKYRLLNRHDTSQNAILKTDEVKTATYKQLQLFSLPFLAYGLLFTFFLLLGIQEMIRFFTSLGYGLMFVYGGFMGFLVVRHFKAMQRIESGFSVPYHQRGVSLSQEDFILINEQLSNEGMTQFSYEVETPQKPLKQKKIRTKFAGDNTYTPQSSNQYSLNPKYKTFMDD